MQLCKWKRHVARVVGPSLRARLWWHVWCIRSWGEICKHEVPKITVRIVQSKKDTNDVETQMTRRYKSLGFPSEFHYQNKCILLFQEIGGIDVLIFGMYVQEYDHNVPKPNNRAVYISYLDTVKYFRPARLRTMMYCEVLISYFSFARERGFAYGFIWACPPEKGDDLFCTVPEAKDAEQQKLQKWYQDLLDNAERRADLFDRLTLGHLLAKRSIHSIS